MYGHTTIVKMATFRSLCIITIYSGFADLDGDDCYGHESDTNWSDSYDYTCTDDYNSHQELYIPNCDGGYVYDFTVELAKSGFPGVS